MNVQTKIKLQDPNGYYGTPFRRWINENLSKYIKKYCPNIDSKVLDLGCGEGQYIKFFEDANIEGSYTGIDYVLHENWSDYNNKNIKDLDIQYIQYDAHKISSINKKYNFISSITAFEHFEDDKKVMKELKRILALNGFLLIIVPSKYSFFNYGKHGFRRYSKKNLKQLNDVSQFHLEKIDKICGLSSFLLHFAWNWIFRIISVIIKLIIMILFGFNKSKARARLPQLHDYLDNLKFIHLLTRIGKLSHKCILILCSKIDKILPLFEVGYIAIYKKK